MDASFPTRSALDDPRFAAHASGAAPAWLWTPDGARVLWANAAGCAVFAETAARALGGRIFAAADPIRLEIARLAATLAADGAARLECLPGLSGQAAASPTLPYTCSFIGLACRAGANPDGGAGAFGVLVIAAEAIGPALSLAERVARLDVDRDDAFAAFAPQGRLLFATAAAKRRLGGAESLVAIGAQPLAAVALIAGAAAGPSALGDVEFLRLGSGSDTVLAGYFESLGDTVSEAMPEEAVDERSAAVTVPPAPRLAEPAADGRDHDAPEPPAKQADAAPDSRPAIDTPDLADSPAAMVASEDEEPRPRSLPVRFTWQMDAGGRFTLGSDEFTEIIGTRIAIALGRPWQEINAELELDPEDRFVRAAATRDTFSNVTVSWPIDGYPERLAVVLAGLPVFGRDRDFLGYRGFGVCRDAGRIETLRTIRRLAMLPTPLAAENPPAQRSAPVALAGASTPASRQEMARPPPPQENVVRFPEAANTHGRPVAPGSVALSPGEYHAFREIARHLAARLEDTEAICSAETIQNHSPAARALSYAGHGMQYDVAGADHRVPAARAEDLGSGHARFDEAAAAQAEDHALLNRLPSGILVCRLDELLFANPAFLKLTGYRDLDAFAAAGGLDALFAGYRIGALAAADGDGRALALATASGGELPVEGRLFAITWGGQPAAAVVLAGMADDQGVVAAETARRQAETQARELRLLLEAATDATLFVDAGGGILWSDRGSENLFGRQAGECRGGDFANLFAPQSRHDALAGLARAQHEAGHAEAVLTVPDGAGGIRVYITIKRVAADNSRFGVAVRRIANVPGGPTAAADTATAELPAPSAPQRESETAPPIAAQSVGAGGPDRTEVLAGLDRELQAAFDVISRSGQVTPQKHSAPAYSGPKHSEPAHAAPENLVRESLGREHSKQEHSRRKDSGPTGDERSLDQATIMSMASADPAALPAGSTGRGRTEDGALPLPRLAVDLNEAVTTAVARLHLDASEARIIIRTALSPVRCAVSADAPAVTRMATILLRHALLTSPPGNQVIVSTGVAGDGGVFLRVRDGDGGSGDGIPGISPMTENAKAGLARPEPAPVAVPAVSSSAQGLRLVKALAEANHAAFRIIGSGRNGSLFELRFPAVAAPAA